MPQAYVKRERAPTAQQESFAHAYARTGDAGVAAVAARYSLKSRSPEVVARNPTIVKRVEAFRFKEMAEVLVPLALRVVKETLSGPASRARDDMARWVVKDWKEEHVSLGAGADGAEVDLGNATPAQLDRMIRELEVQQAALETIAAGKAKDVTPSQDVIDAAQPISDCDVFG
jgi:hypothetical protein